MPEFAIETKDLTKKFGDFTAVNQISFDVKRGEIFGLGILPPWIISHLK